MARVAIAHGATIDKYIGDAVMIFFGDPESHGVAEDARRCVAMAIEMLRRLDAIRGEHDDRGRSYPIRVRIGIATGYCTVGNFGSEDRLDYTICGTPVNLAQRMQTHAAPDGILVSEGTYSLLDGAFPAVEAGTIRLKGISRPVKAFDILTSDSDDEDRYVQVRNRGMQIFLDLDRLDPTTGETALAALDEARSRLRQRLGREANAAG
jgi:adenylate cyclase